MAIVASFVHCLPPNILYTWPHDSFHVTRLSMALSIFQGHWTVSHQISQKRCVIRQSYCRLLIGNYLLIGATFDDLKVHLKVISAYVVISTHMSTILGMLSCRTVSQQ